jgi:hypothetical protein
MHFECDVIDKKVRLSETGLKCALDVLERVKCSINLFSSSARENFGNWWIRERTSHIKSGRQFSLVVQEVIYLVKRKLFARPVGHTSCLFDSFLPRNLQLSWNS